MSKKLTLVIIIILIASEVVFAQEATIIGQTKITKWQYGKKAAISITYDDNTINQFRVALPLMKKFGFPATFYVITGIVPGSKFQPKFIGPPIEKVISESAEAPTNKKNFFLRASALRFLGFEDTYRYFMQVGGQYEQGNIQKAYHLIDEVYKKVRDGELKPIDPSVEVRNGILKYGQSTYSQFNAGNVKEATWPQLKKYQSQGYEIGSHTIDHPYMSILDSANIMYELKKSKQEIQEHLGPQAAFSAELPFGITNKRAIRYGLKVYEVLRNQIPEPYITEINRGDPRDPTNVDNDYVQWQRGPVSDTPMQKMKSWVNTVLKKNNIWLVLVIHGVEGIGWEPLTKKELHEYFSFIKNKEKDIWVATFKDVAKYIRERKNAVAYVKNENDAIKVYLYQSLNDSLYNLPLTLKTYVPENWRLVSVKQGSSKHTVQVREDKHGYYVLYKVNPNGKPIKLAKL